MAGTRGNWQSPQNSHFRLWHFFYGFGHKMLWPETPHMGQARHGKGKFRHTFTVTASQQRQARASCFPKCTAGSWLSSSAGIGGGQLCTRNGEETQLLSTGQQSHSILPRPRPVVRSSLLAPVREIGVRSSEVSFPTTGLLHTGNDWHWRKNSITGKEGEGKREREVRMSEQKMGREWETERKGVLNTDQPSCPVPSSSHLPHLRL